MNITFPDRLKKLLRNREFVLGLVVLGFFLILAIAAPLIAPPQSDQPYLVHKQGFSRAPEPPRPGFPLGSLPGGYDVLYGLVWGVRVAFALGAVIVTGRALIGLLVGMAAGYSGGWLDGLLMRLTDAFLTFPIMAIAAVLLALYSQPSFIPVGPRGILLGNRPNQIIIATLVGFGWMQYARLVRGNLLIEKEKEYIQAAIATGAGWGRLLFRHLLPNSTRGLFELATSEIGTMVVLMAAFRFVGLTGVTTGEMFTDWGMMLTISRDWIAGGSNQAAANWYTYVPTSLVILLFSIGWNLAGEGMRQAFDPRSRPAYKPGKRIKPAKSRKILAVAALLVTLTAAAGGGALLVARMVNPPAAISPVIGDGTPASCTPQALVEALTRGGEIELNCGEDTLVFYLKEEISIAHETSLNGKGLVAFDGKGATRLFNVLPEGALTLRGVTLRGGSSKQGGAIYSVGKLNLFDCTLLGNAAAQGGAVFNSGGSLAVVNSTFTENEASEGGAIFNARGSARLLNTTVAGNSAISAGGGIASPAGNAILGNVILSRNPPGNCLGEVLDQGGNLSWPESDSTCPASILRGNPRLKPLEKLPGATATMELEPGSAASSLGSPELCTRPLPNGAAGKDQRGASRSATCDSGAYESDIQPLYLPIILQSP